MAVDWPRLTLREAHVSLIDCDHRTPPASDSGYPYVAIPQLNDGRIDVTSARRITPAHFVEWTRRATPSPDDVVLSRRTNPGETGFVPQGLEFALGQNLVLLRADGTVVYPPFLRWLVRGPEWWEQISRFLNVGAVFDSLKCADIPNFRLRIPPLSEQRRIAHILGTLDDKIELNRRTNGTLEAIGRAIFKSWFVDFDPVRAKSEGRDPGLPKHVADLFPDLFVDSELGEVPQGWVVQPFSDTIEIIGGGTPKTSVAEYWNGDVPWFSVVDAPIRSDVWVVNTEKKITSDGVEKSSTRVLPVGTTIISARGTVGRVALVGVPMAMNQSCYGVLGKAGAHGFFTYFAARELVVILQQHAHGSVFDTITRDTLAGVSVALPPTALIEAFEDLVLAAMERLRSALVESGTLTTLRDTLLPKLIPGELRARAVGRLMDATAAK
jgi:type I restriction enzyme, S subunit